MKKSAKIEISFNSFISIRYFKIHPIYSLQYNYHTELTKVKKPCVSGKENTDSKQSEKLFVMF